MHYFTLTAGRSGSAWLASFLAQNLQVPEVHEHLGVNDFGVKMPDIRTMRNFNTFGNNNFVKEFWTRKFSTVLEPLYAETNHTLGKCGLVENVILHKRSKFTTIVVLKRDIKKQVLSYIKRHDFANVTVAWQWYLDPRYKKNLVNSQPFGQFGAIGLPMWYSFEMLARQEYYLYQFSDHVRMLEFSLEQLNTLKGAEELMREMGLASSPIIPPVKNAGAADKNDELSFLLDKSFGQIDLDIRKHVREAVKKGFSF